MKDIIIKGSSIRRELFILLASLVVAEGINLYAVISMARPAKEMITMIGFVAVTGIAIYLLILIIRMLVRLVCRIFRKRQPDQE